MRTGADYRDSLRDGRKVWVLGEGPVDDVTTHPATAAMVREYVRWYDRHFDPAWRDLLVAPAEGSAVDAPVWGTVPTTADDLRRLGDSYAATIFQSAGNITHTPAYGALIALGIVDAVQRWHNTDNLPAARAYRDRVAATGRFITFSYGGATIGYRMREDPASRAPTRLVKETDAGIVVSGKVGMHTSVAYAEDVYLGTMSAVRIGDRRATFAVEVASPGVTVVCRKAAVRHPNPFVAPLSNRFDELDAQLWLDDVFVPWERVFFSEAPPEGVGAPPPLDPLRSTETIASWLFWHQLYAWLAKGEFTLGLALALTDAMGLRANPPTIELLVDLMVDVQTVRACIEAAELNPELTATGYALPRPLHIASGSLTMLRARQRLTEILRTLPGSSLVVAPADSDLDAPGMAAGLEESFGGGGYTARQRAALLNAAWDHISSGLDGRESAFELHANGGVPVWRNRLRAWFADYNALANGVLSALNLDIPPVDVEGLRSVLFGPRRPVTPPR